MMSHHNVIYNVNPKINPPVLGNTEGGVPLIEGYSYFITFQFPPLHLDFHEKSNISRIDSVFVMFGYVHSFFVLFKNNVL